MRSTGPGWRSFAVQWSYGADGLKLSDQNEAGLNQLRLLPVPFVLAGTTLADSLVVFRTSMTGGKASAESPLDSSKIVWGSVIS